jgi:endonuclease III
MRTMLRHFIPLATTCSVALSAMAQNPAAELDALVKKIKPRSEVLDTANELTLQVILPPQYSQCLYAALVEAGQKNNVANSYLLEQIDLLTEAGLPTSSISGIIAYGHAITNVVFALELGKPVDELQGDDFKTRQTHIYRTFKRLACVNNFSDERVQSALRELIKRARPQTPR